MNRVELLDGAGSVLCSLRATEHGRGLRIDAAEILSADWLAAAKTMRVLDLLGAVVHEAPLEELHEAD
jgi:hypothetical protein